MRNSTSFRKRWGAINSAFWHLPDFRKVVGRFDTARGEENEKRALRIILRLISSGQLELDSWWPPEISRRNSKLDKAGIDIVLTTKPQLCGIQIKSSYPSLEKFLREDRSIAIPGVVVNEGKSDQRLEIELLAAAKHAYANRGAIDI